MSRSHQSLTHDDEEQRLDTVVISIVVMARCYVSYNSKLLNLFLRDVISVTNKETMMI